jgi:hypothetical protein
MQKRTEVGSVVIPRLKKTYALGGHRVHQPMLLSDPARPRPREDVLQRLGFAETLERIAHHGFHEIENAESDAAVGFDPVAEVLPELRMEDRDAGTATLRQGLRLLS